jgi:hypothetical protein
MEHARLIKGNNPQSAYALHILINQHEYGPMEKTMTLFKPLKNTSLLTPYEHLFKQFLHKAGKLILEQNPGKINPLLQLAFNPSQLLTVTSIITRYVLCLLLKNPLQNSHNLNLPLLITCTQHPGQHPMIPQTS